MVVRNHEGGTCTSAWQRKCRRELAPRSGRLLGMSEEGRTRISREGGVAERRHQHSRERFEVEVKVMRAVTSRFRSRKAAESGNPRGPSRQRQKVEEGAGKAKQPATSSAIGVEQHRFPTQAAPAALKIRLTTWKLTVPA